MRFKRITAHRALTMLRYLERVRQESASNIAVRCVIDEAIDMLDSHVRRALTVRRRRP